MQLPTTQNCLIFFLGISLAIQNIINEENARLVYCDIKLVNTSWSWYNLNISVFKNYRKIFIFDIIIYIR